MRPRYRNQRVFSINLSSRHRAYLKPARLGLMILVLIIVVAVAWDVIEIGIAAIETHNIESALERVKEQDQHLLAEAAKQGIDLSDGAMQRLSGEVTFANQLIGKRVFSWTQFLTELEQAIPSRLAINSIRLDAGTWTIRLTGSALSLEDVTALTVALQDHATFKDPVLGQHRDSENGLVDFDLAVRYQKTRK
ncbi:MAG: PilN domain-containing protein [Nitrospiraceae bacterium]